MDDVNKTPGFKEKVKLVFVSFGSRELGGNRDGRPSMFGGDPKGECGCVKTGRYKQRLLRFPGNGPRILELRRACVNSHRFCLRISRKNNVMS